MTYSEKKADEILNEINKIDLDACSATDLTNIFELKIKEIIRDVRHKCAENVLKADTGFNGEQPLITKDQAHNVVMNTNLDYH